MPGGNPRGLEFVGRLWPMKVAPRRTPPSGTLAAIGLVSMGDWIARLARRALANSKQETALRRTVPRRAVCGGCFLCESPEPALHVLLLLCPGHGQIVAQLVLSLIYGSSPNQ
jgi:hypothetical protein